MWSVCVVSYSITYFVCGDPPFSLSLSLSLSLTHIDVSLSLPFLFSPRAQCFSCADAFNQPLGEWDVSRVTNMRSSE